MVLKELYADLPLKKVILCNRFSLASVCLNILASSQWFSMLACNISKLITLVCWLLDLEETI